MTAKQYELVDHLVPLLSTEQQSVSPTKAYTKKEIEEVALVLEKAGLMRVFPLKSDLLWPLCLTARGMEFKKSGMKYQDYERQEGINADRKAKGDELLDLQVRSLKETIDVMNEEQRGMWRNQRRYNNSLILIGILTFLVALINLVCTNRSLPSH